MNTQEALAAIADGHTMYSTDFAKEVCHALDVEFGNNIIYRWQSQADANPNNHPKGLFLERDEPGEGVYSLALAWHIAHELGVDNKVAGFHGRGTQAREIARVVREHLIRNDRQAHPDGGSRDAGALTEGQHTAGPWHVGESGSSIFAERRDGEGDWRHVANAIDPDDTLHFTSIVAANARLIAQAPDLLAEADRLRQQNAELRKALEHVMQAHAGACPLCRKARAALARSQP